MADPLIGIARKSGILAASSYRPQIPCSSVLCVGVDHKWPKRTREPPRLDSNKWSKGSDKTQYQKGLYGSTHSVSNSVEAFGRNVETCVVQFLSGNLISHAVTPLVIVSDYVRVA